ncbi:glutamine amidotransferase of anthranilate synthase [Desulfosudis oleivorans Hxd3]|uniref:Glutamine amidotransferase of anthranilate synthase n=2 Tax=Desulfosudis TaxID=2904716 RepID=A8ZX49_DESOH|nr:glutamine amidotransferase of anthranilate synthase [Desulfosudis oleivorans Hxd3]
MGDRLSGERISIPIAIPIWMKGKMKHLLVIDNYDSFTYNLVQLFSLFHLNIQVHRGDKITVAEVAAASPDYILISPGPRTPAHAGISIDLVRTFSGRVPILGVCLGMQCINEAFGGATVRCPVPVHGKTSLVFHRGDRLFAGLPSPFTAARYHSLMIQQNSDALCVTATTEDNVIMGLRHPDHLTFGVQFHPESFLTEHGKQLAKNFLSQG